MLTFNNVLNDCHNKRSTFIMKITRTINPKKFVTEFRNVSHSRAEVARYRLSLGLKVVS